MSANLGVQNAFCETLVVGAIGCLLAIGGCSGELEGPTPELTGEPGASASSDRLMEPPFTCNSQLENNWIQVRGDGFSPLVADSLEDPEVDAPVVELERSTELKNVRDTGEATGHTFEDFDPENNPQGDNKKRLRWLDQKTLEILVDGELNLKPGLYDLTVTNPTDASVTKSEAFAVLPRPRVESVEPQLACDGDREIDVTVSGGPFLQNRDGQNARVSVGDQQYTGDAVSAGSCNSFDSGPLSGWSICQELTVTLPLGDYDPGLHNVTVDNRSPRSDADFGCESTDQVQFRVLRRPIVDSVEPSPVCTKQNSYTVKINGDNFVFDKRGEGTESPTVTIGGEQTPVTGPSSPNDSGNCEETSIDEVFSCQQLQVEVEEGLLHEDGTVTSDDVFVDNPPGMTECKNNDPGTIRNAPPPQVSNATIFEACGDAPDRMVVEGAYHFEMGGVVPEVDVSGPGGNTVTYSGGDLSLTGECSGELENTSEPTEHCNMTEFDLDSQTDASGGNYEISYNNPETVQCSVTETLMNVQTETPNQPVIDGIEEDALCASGAEDSLTINGENFKSGATVTINGNEADSVSVSGDGTQIEATWMSSFDVGNDPTLTVTNPDSCTVSTNLGGDLEIVDGPVAVFLDPSIHYNQIDVRGTLFVARGTGRNISKVQIREDDQMGTERDLSFNNPNNNDGEVQPLLPKEDPSNAGNALPTGPYDVRVTEQVGADDTECGAWRDKLLEVTDKTDLALESISPQYGEEGTSTGVTLTADSGAISANQFQATPRVFLSPTSGGANVVATELSAVAFNSSTEVSGIVPDSLPTGDYRVVAINPNGNVGVLSPPDGFTVTQDSPPILNNISPGSWDNSNSSLSVTLSGTALRSGTGSGNVSVTCESGMSPNSVSISSTSGTNGATLTVDATNLTAGDVCELTYENPNGSKDSISPIGITEPAFNFVSFDDSSGGDSSMGTSSDNLNMARIWPAMSSGVASREQKFLYVIGGDNSGVLSSGEFGAIDRFGNIESWNMQRYQLPDGRAYTRSARVRDFVYVVGGNNGNGPTTDIHRANVLDPEHNPDISGLDFEFVDTSSDGLAPGEYFYRVSVVHDGSDPHNPDGETLASDVQPVSVPDLSEFNVQVTLDWNSSLNNVKEFRVYRTAKNDPVGTEQLLATFGPGTTQFTDDGTRSFSSDEPLPIGSTGQWRKVGDLNTAREKHAMRGTVNPENENRAYIWVMGGENGSGALTSIERIQINDADTSTPRSQTVDSVDKIGDLSTARTEAELSVATPQNADNLSSGDGFLYLTGGTTSVGGMATGDVISWPIDFTSGASVGSPTNWAPPGLTKSRSGHIGTVANTYVIAASGQNGAPSSSGDNSQVIDPASGDPGNWNSLSGSVAIDSRFRAGREAFSGFLYIGGGDDGSGAMSDVEWSVVGSTREKQ